MKINAHYVANMFQKYVFVHMQQYKSNVNDKQGHCCRQKLTIKIDLLEQKNKINNAACLIVVAII